MSGKDGGWILPEVIDPAGRICVCIPVPDEPAHRQAFWGALTELYYQHNWQRDSEHKALPTSIVWSEIILEAQARFYSGEIYMCFTCQQLQDCLQPLLDAQRSQIIRDLRYGDDSGVPPGEVPPASQNEQNLAAETNPECSKDILWAQCTQLVDTFVDLTEDMLEIAEAATNDTEMLQVFGELPIINEFGIAAVFAYIDLLLEGVAENFSAQITQGYKDEYACLIMQACCHDCEVTVERLYEVASERMRTHFATFPTAFATIFDLWTYLTDQDIDGTIIADAMLMMCIGGGFLANAFFAAVSIRPIQVVLGLAKNDANDDWLILCPDCPNLFEVPATSDPALDEYFTGFTVVAATEYHIVATGLWNGGAGADVDADGQIGVIDPLALVPTANLYSLCYRVGLLGTWEFCGVDLIFTPASTGDLYFALNDETGAYTDNFGVLTVSIEET